MRRAFLMPVSAAVVGALLAVGVTALDRPHRHEVRFVAQDLGELVDVREVREVERAVRRVEREVRREVERNVLREVRSNIPVTLLDDVKQDVISALREAAAEEELTAEEREKILQAIEEIESELPLELGLAGLLEGITREDGSAHRDVVDAPEAPAVLEVPAVPEAPVVPQAPAPSAGNAGN